MNKQDKIKMLRDMLLIRQFEEAAGEQYNKGKIRGFLHLYIGEEAVAVGFISALREDDYVVTAYRDHGQCLAKGCPSNQVMAELFGKETGISRGKGGSMHLFDASKNFLGGTGIVGGGLPLAAGVGMAINYNETDQVCMCFFGDGAVNEGAFHESLNVAGLWKLPVIFICENNQYGMGTAVSRVSALPRIVDRAKCYAIDTEVVDGMDAIACRELAERVIENARKHKAPAFIEAVTYRFRGHSVADPEKYRTKDEIEEWRKRDPIELLKNHLLSSGDLSLADFEKLQAETSAEVTAAIQFADSSPEPVCMDMYEDVYA